MIAPYLDGLGLTLEFDCVAEDSGLVYSFVSLHCELLSDVEDLHVWKWIMLSFSSKELAFAENRNSLVKWNCRYYFSIIALVILVLVKDYLLTEELQFWKLRIQSQKAKDVQKIEVWKGKIQLQGHVWFVKVENEGFW